MKIMNNIGSKYFPREKASKVAPEAGLVARPLDYRQPARTFSDSGQRDRSWANDDSDSNRANE
jgi:hypothetical protein